MYVGIDNSQHQELVDAYNIAARTLLDVRSDLTPLLSEAQELLGHPVARPVHIALSGTAVDLERDASDLQRRGEFLIEADARVAMQVAEQAGDLLNSFLVQDALKNGWTYREAELRNELAQLRKLSKEGQIRRANDIRRIEETLRILEGPHSAIGVTGDLDHNFENVRIGPPLRLYSRTPESRGRDLIIRALEDTANQDILLQDEFQAILHENGNLTLVLPGVVDLSNKFKLWPEFGWEEEHNTTRDLEMGAVNSSLSTEIEDNEYGRRVRDWIRFAIQEGIIEPGTQTSIIGHSYGGDSALDLAADPEVNGVLLNVTHVIPMAYHNEPQFEDLPDETRVLALQNIWDAPVFGEAIGAIARHPQNIKEPVGSAARSGVEVVESLADGGSWLINETLNEIEGAVDEELGIRFDVPAIPKAEFKHDDYRSVSNEILLVEFEGGFSGFGHHQDHYVHFLERPTDERVASFFLELDDAGFTADGTTVSIDVTKSN